MAFTYLLPPTHSLLTVTWKVQSTVESPNCDVTRIDQHYYRTEERVEDSSGHPGKSQVMHISGGDSLHRHYSKQLSNDKNCNGGRGRGTSPLVQLIEFLGFLLYIVPGFMAKWKQLSTSGAMVCIFDFNSYESNRSGEDGGCHQ